MLKNPSNETKLKQYCKEEWDKIHSDVKDWLKVFGLLLLKVAQADLKFK